MCRSAVWLERAEGCLRSCINDAVVVEAGQSVGHSSRNSSIRMLFYTAKKTVFLVCQNVGWQKRIELDHTFVMRGYYHDLERRHKG